MQKIVQTLVNLLILLCVHVLCTFRDILELTEAIKVKDAESEAYISEIEVLSLTFIFFLHFSSFWMSY